MPTAVLTLKLPPLNRMNLCRQFSVQRAKVRNNYVCVCVCMCECVCMHVYVCVCVCVCV